MVESTCSFQHTSSHPDKYNNSVNRIISKEEEREDPRRDTSVSVQLEYKCVSSNSTRITRFLRIQCIPTRTTMFPHAIQQPQVSTVNSTYRINSTTRNTTTTRLIPCHPVQISTRHLPATVPHVIQAFYMAESRLLRLPYSIPGPHGTSRLPVNSTRQKQHSKWQPASTQLPTAPSRQTSQECTSYYRILPGEIGFIPKGSSIVYLCNTKVNVFQVTYSCA